MSKLEQYGSLMMFVRPLLPLFELSLQKSFQEDYWPKNGLTLSIGWVWLDTRTREMIRNA